MSRLVCHQHNRVGAWVMERCQADWYAGKGVTLGLEDDHGTLLIGAVFESYNGTNMNVALACKSHLPFFPRSFLHVCADYCFIKNHCSRITCIVDSSNHASISLVERVGWIEETRLVGAGLRGGDLIVYKMTPETCKWLLEDSENELC